LELDGRSKWTMRGCSRGDGKAAAEEEEAGADADAGAGLDLRAGEAAVLRAGEAAEAVVEAAVESLVAEATADANAAAEGVEAGGTTKRLLLDLDLLDLPGPLPLLLLLLALLLGPGTASLLDAPVLLGLGAPALGLVSKTEVVVEVGSRGRGWSCGCRLVRKGDGGWNCVWPLARSPPGRAPTTFGAGDARRCRWGWGWGCCRWTTSFRLLSVSSAARAVRVAVSLLRVCCAAGWTGGAAYSESNRRCSRTTCPLLLALVVVPLALVGCPSWTGRAAAGPQ